MGAKRRVRDFEQLVERMRSVEAEAFREFADHFGPPFRAMFIRRGLTPPAAEDLAVSCISDIAPED